MLAKIPKISLFFTRFPFINQRYIRIFAKKIYAVFFFTSKIRDTRRRSTRQDVALHHPQMGHQPHMCSTLVQTPLRVLLVITLTQGDFKDYQTVYNFGKNLDVLTIEIEHVNTDALRQLEKEGVQTYPNAATLELIQNKGVQKDFYAQHNIPTSAHMRFENKEHLGTS